MARSSSSSATTTRSPREDSFLLLCCSFNTSSSLAVSLELREWRSSRSRVHSTTWCGGTPPGEGEERGGGRGGGGGGGGELPQVGLEQVVSPRLRYSHLVHPVLEGADGLLLLPEPGELVLYGGALADDDLHQPLDGLPALLLVLHHRPAGVRDVPPPPLLPHRPAPPPPHPPR